MPDTYKVVRFYKGTNTKRTIKTGLTLQEAQAHCSDPETASDTCTSKAGVERTECCGDWFDGYAPEIS